MTIFSLKKFDIKLYCKPTLNLNKVFINSAKQFLIIIKGLDVETKLQKIVSRSASDIFKYK